MNRLVAALLLVAVSPLLIVIAVLVKIDSPGPAIFPQRRVGKDGTYFIMYKFRTMVFGMPDVPSDQVDENDNRFTRLGRFLRRTSLDELPQLVNIIKGEMNFIGPRPALYNQDELIRLRREYGIAGMKPGITGWAQVNGRESILVLEKVELERFYLQHGSCWMDIRILWMTVFKTAIGADLYKRGDS